VETQSHISQLLIIEVRIEVQKPRVHNWRRMRSVENCGKGNLPKLEESHVLKAGSVLNKYRTVI
jgi:hypothetical protein